MTAAVPGVAGWRLAALPRGLTREQVRALLAPHDTTTAVGLRDHAFLVMLARLGMRGAEAAALQLEDVDWRGGQIVVPGKGPGGTPSAAGRGRRSVGRISHRRKTVV